MNLKTSLPPITIAQIYKNRWQIEWFFKIKSFLGTSKNAVLSQIWSAMCYFLLLAYIKFQTKYRPSLFYLAAIIRETLFHRFTLIVLIHLSLNKLAHPFGPDPQLFLQL